MLLSIILFSSLAFSFILKGSYENIFIVLATMSFYKQVIVNKNYKSLIYGVLISFIGVNLVISFIFKDYIVIKEVQPVKEKEETLVLLVSEGENKNYNIKERSTQIYYEEGYKGMITGISNLYNYKSYYSKLGFSEFKHKAEEIAEKLRHSLGNGYRVVNSYMYSKPYFEYSVESIIEQGYKKIIICPLFMTEGTDYEVFMNRYEQLNLTSMNIADVEVLEPFYNANNLAQLYKDEILKNIRKSEEDSGVLLIGLHNKNNLEQDILFREKIKKYIEDSENDIDIQIKLPLLENNKKDIIKSGEELLEYGIKTLYVVAPTSTIDTMYTRHLVNSILEELDMGDTKFYYIDPPDKINTLVDTLYTKIILMHIQFKFILITKFIILEYKIDLIIILRSF